MRLIDADALQKAIDSLPISPLMQEVFKGHVDVAIANAPTVAKDTNVLSNGWISVKDKLPEPPAQCLVYSAKASRPRGMETATYTELGWMTAAYFPGITHWMPLPEPPKEEA